MTATERVPAVLMAISGAAIAFVLVTLLHAAGGVSEREENRVFVLSCILVPITGIVVAALVDMVKRRFFENSSLFYPLVAFANLVIWIALVTRIRVALPPPKTGAQVPLGPVFGKMLVVWASGNIAAISFVGLVHRKPWAEWIGARLSPWLERLLPFVVFYTLLPFTMHTPPVPWKVVALLAVAGVATLLHREAFTFPRGVLARLAFDALVLVALALVLVDPAGDVNTLHHNFYLGPAAAVRAGKSLLVDVNCQYGVGIIYFLGALLRFGLMRPSMQGLSVVVGIFAVVQYAAFYLSLRMTTRSAGLSALVTAVGCIVATFEQVGYPSEYPSTGGIRFLPGFLFVLCQALKARFPRQTSKAVVLEALVIGASSIWSFESFIYVLVAYLGSVVYEVAHAPSGRIKSTLAARVGPVLVSVAGWHLWLIALTRVRSGQWPHWSYYFDFIKLYSVQEFGTLPIEPWTPWLVIGGVYAAAITALGYRRLVEENTVYRPDLAVVFSMAALGVGQYTYFLGRSHFNNLFHICLPAFFVAGYAFIRAARDVRGVSHRFRRWFTFVAWSALTLCFFSGVAEAASKYDHTELAYLITHRKAKAGDVPKRVQDMVDLINHHAPGKRLVVMFTQSDLEVDVFLRSHRASVYPVAFLQEDFLLPSAKARILDFHDDLKVGDIIFVDVKDRPLPDATSKWKLAIDVDVIDLALWDHIQARFGFEVVEKRPTGPIALRLTPR